MCTGNGNPLVHALTQQNTIPSSSAQSLAGTNTGSLPNPWNLNTRFAVGIAVHIGF